VKPRLQSQFRSEYQNPAVGDRENADFGKATPLNDQNPHAISYKSVDMDAPIIKAICRTGLFREILAL